MIDGIENLSNENKLILEKLFENLTQGGNQNGTISSTENRSETPSDDDDAEMEEQQTNGTTSTPNQIILQGDVAAEMSRQLQFVGHQLVKLICGIGKTPCMCSNCSNQMKKNFPMSEETKRKNQPDSESNPVTSFIAQDVQLVNQLVKQIKSTGATHNYPESVELNEDGSLKRKIIALRSKLFL
jgi:hypothetical protein